MNKSKDLRNQLRQLAPELLTEELLKVLETKLVKLINTRLDKIEARHKDVLGLMIRQASKN